MLNALIQFSIRNKLLIGLLVIGLVVAGAFQLRRLSIDALPDITSNQVQVITVSPALAAPEVERLVTFTVEQYCSNIPGISEMRSISRFGLSVVTLVFDDDTEIYWARQQVAERLAYIKDEIPAGAGIPALAPLTTGLGEVFQYLVKPKPGYEAQYSLADLRSIQDWIVRRQLLGTPGVADVSSFGGHLRQYEVAFNADRLNSLGVSVDELFRAVEQNNQNSGGAYLEKNNQVLFIRTEGLARSIGDIEQIVVKQNQGGPPLLVRDVATVQMGKAIRYGALVDGSRGEAAGAVVLMLKGANGLEVVERVKKRIAEISRTLPEGIVLEPFYDRSKMVNRAISTVKTNLAEGALIVIVVLVFFLGNLRAGLLVASVIPLSMLFAFCMMRWFGVSGNLMSLGALDFGLIVDGAVIIVEAVLYALHHHAKKEGMFIGRGEMDLMVGKAASQMMNAAVFGQVIILIVYLPILALSGIEGKMFRPMAQTVAFALLGAFILSLTYVPMMSAWVLSRRITHKTNFSDRVMAVLGNAFLPLLNRAFQWRKALVVGVLALFGVSLVLMQRLGGEFLPELEEGDFAVDTRLLTGSSLQASVEASTKAAQLLESHFPEVEKIVCRVGSSEIPTDPMPIEMGDLIVLLKDKKKWKSANSFDEMADTMSKVLSEVPGLSAGFQFPVQMRFNELISGARQDVVCKLFGEDLDTLARYAAQIGEVAGRVQGATDLYVEAVSGLPQIVVQYKYAALAAYGVQIEWANKVVQTAFAGSAAGQVYEGERKYDLVLRLDSTQRSSVEDVMQLKIPTANGSMISLSQIADVTIKEGPNQIQREDAKRRIITAFNVRGRDIESVVKELKLKLEKQVKLPPGYFIRYGGAFQNLDAARGRLMIAVPVSLFLILIMLYFTFRSVPQALLIFSAIPLSAIGGVLALWLRQMPFSISAGIGFIALFGVAVLNGIVLIAEFNRLRKTHPDMPLKELVIQGTFTRFRPVLLTASVASLGFLPMALSHNPGAEVQRPLASVVIGGLVSATFLTLIILPVLYHWLHGRQRRVSMVPPAAVLLFVLSLCGLHSEAQQTLSLQDALSKLKTDNPEWQLSELDAQWQLTMQAGAGIMPKTRFAAELGQTNSANFDSRLMVLQALNPAGLKKAEQQSYGAAAQTALLQAHLRQAELRFLVRNLYADYGLLQANLQRRKVLDSMYARLEKLSDQRVKQGEAPALEYLGYKQARALQRQQMMQLQMEQSRIQTQLQILLRLPSMPGMDISRIDDPEPWLIDTATMTRHPAVALRQQQWIQAKAETDLRRAQLKPEWEIGYINQSLVGYQTKRDGTEVFYGAARRFSSAQVGLAVPLFNKAMRQQVKAAELKEQVASKIVANTLQQDALRLQQLQREYVLLKEQESLFSQQLLPDAETILKLANQQLQAGAMNYLQWMMLVQHSLDVPFRYYDIQKASRMMQASLAYYAEQQK